MSINGWTEDRRLTNAHLSYKGKSIIVDYEWCLHPYPMSKSDNYVPIEVFPFGDDGIKLEYVKLDKKFKKVDIEEIIEKVDDMIYDENTLF